MKEIKVPTTNAIRILEAAKINFTLHQYEVDSEHLDALSASKKAGLNPEIVYKTIVLKSNRNILYVFCLPSEFEISLKKAKKLTDEKELELLKMEDLFKYTGYVRGGCSPLAMKKPYKTYISDLAQLEDKICVSAGLRGLQIELSPLDLIKVTNAEFADFI